MPRRLLFDTDVLVEYLRGKRQAVEFVEGMIGDSMISTITVAELFAGAKGRSHGTGLADALIAATAALHSAQLVTFNVRHFPMIPGIRIPYARR